MKQTPESTQTDQLEALGRLFRMLSRSLPMYFKDARPWTPPGHEQAADVLDRLASDQARYAQLVAEAITARDGRADPGCFPLEYTALSDVSLQHALQHACQQQRQHVEEIARCRQQLASDPELQQLAEEIYRNALEHLEILQRAVAQGQP